MLMSFVNPATSFTLHKQPVAHSTEQVQRKENIPNTLWWYINTVCKEYLCELFTLAVKLFTCLPYFLWTINFASWLSDFYPYQQKLKEDIAMEFNQIFSTD